MERRAGVGGFLLPFVCEIGLTSTNPGNDDRGEAYIHVEMHTK